ncbi:hypothetical protein GCM10011533_30210 [Streptosporangium jomthongense]|uniref:Transposase n=1 Tax=Marinobacter aromaticivorans TaxID=1494078 RepID=A0ABW2IYV4_9GAMM|nr:hypothetical protein [Marinobacter aromaticivorans]GGE75821.1 hypothetical protein GCM10011533_30210 [Streptosporangium jomthongense]
MTHYQKRLKAREAAREYMAGAKLRRDSEQLADKVLAAKFGCNEVTIKRVKNRLPVGVLDEDDQKLIRLCAREKAELDQKIIRLTKAALSRQYQVSQEAINIELDLMGFKSSRVKRKKKATTA